MALKSKQTINSETSIQQNGLNGIAKSSISEEVYVKVEKVVATKSTANCLVSFSGDKLNGMNNYEFNVNLDGVNFIKQAYLHLKTLPEFASAVDC
jgi:hypothetical protein